MFNNNTQKLGTIKPKYGLFFFNAPSEVKTYKEIKEETAQKIRAKKLKMGEKLVIPEKINNPDATRQHKINTANNYDTSPIKWIPLHRQRDQASPYFSMDYTYHF